MLGDNTRHTKLGKLFLYGCGFVHMAKQEKAFPKLLPQSVKPRIVKNGMLLALRIPLTGNKGPSPSQKCRNVHIFLVLLGS